MKLPSAGTLASILVVDDTPENVDVLAGVLNPLYHVKVALSGEKALRIARSETPPDLILLDVMMPELDGYEVCRRLKADPATQDIPVIFVTARSEVEDESRGFEMGAVDYLTKPICAPLVLARVKTQLVLRQSVSRLSHLTGQLGRYLSPQIYQSLIEGRSEARIQTSRKKLTVFFSDIVGFSAQTDILEPEDLHNVLNSYLNCMSELVLKHGGTLDKFIGDAILAFFGDPESRGFQEDALACVRMAIEMKQAIRELRTGWLAQGITTPFEVRMGITTGYCTVGNFGSEQRMSYTIIGNQVNLASRLETAAAPGQILVSADTWSLVQGSVGGKALEPIRVKGFEHPVQPYQILGLREVVSPDQSIGFSGEGFSVALDPAVIGESERMEVVERLESAAALLRARNALKKD
jgi:adenylate cyclase